MGKSVNRNTIYKTFVIYILFRSNIYFVVEVWYQDLIYIKRAYVLCHHYDKNINGISI